MSSTRAGSYPPSGIRVSPDESVLLVADNGSRWVWSFQIRPDGSLSNGEPYHHLELPDGVEDGPIRSGAAGLVMDADGFLYTATKLGIQSGSSSAVRICTLYTWRPATQSSAGRLRSHGVFPWIPVRLPEPEL